MLLENKRDIIFDGTGSPPITSYKDSICGGGIVQTTDMMNDYGLTPDARHRQSYLSQING